MDDKDLEALSSEVQLQVVAMLGALGIFCLLFALTLGVVALLQYALYRVLSVDYRLHPGPFEAVRFLVQAAALPIAQYRLARDLTRRFSRPWMAWAGSVAAAALTVLINAKPPFVTGLFRCLPIAGLVVYGGVLGLREGHLKEPPEIS